jgi:hypothetical protein
MEETAPEVVVPVEHRLHLELHLFQVEMQVLVKVGTVLQAAVVMEQAEVVGMVAVVRVVVQATLVV